jgi:hypothetical protein
MTHILRNGETAEDVRERVGSDYDIPASVLLDEVYRDTDLSTAIRTYPADDEADYDVPNQICWDLKGTWKWRAVAVHDPDGEAVEWYGHSGDVLEYWPDFYDEPVWKRYSVYAFIQVPDDYTLALHPWPVDMDPDAEVVG